MARRVRAAVAASIASVAVLAAAGGVAQAATRTTRLPSLCNRYQDGDAAPDERGNLSVACVAWVFRDGPSGCRRCGALLGGAVKFRGSLWAISGVIGGLARISSTGRVTRRGPRLPRRQDVYAIKPGLNGVLWLQGRGGGRGGRYDPSVYVHRVAT